MKINNIKIIFFILLVVFLVTVCYNRNKNIETFGINFTYTDLNISSSTQTDMQEYINDYFESGITNIPTLTKDASKIIYFYNNYLKIIHKNTTLEEVLKGFVGNLFIGITATKDHPGSSEPYYAYSKHYKGNEGAKKNDWRDSANLVLNPEKNFDGVYSPGNSTYPNYSILVSNIIEGVNIIRGGDDQAGLAELVSRPANALINYSQNTDSDWVTEPEPGNTAIEKNQLLFNGWFMKKIKDYEDGEIGDTTTRGYFAANKGPFFKNEQFIIDHLDDDRSILRDKTKRKGRLEYYIKLFMLGKNDDLDLIDHIGIDLINTYKSTYGSSLENSFATFRDSVITSEADELMVFNNHKIDKNKIVNDYILANNDYSNQITILLNSLKTELLSNSDYDKLLGYLYHYRKSKLGDSSASMVSEGKKIYDTAVLSANENVDSRMSKIVEDIQFDEGEINSMKSKIDYYAGTTVILNE